jgi:hypothetical protein
VTVQILVSAVIFNLHVSMVTLRFFLRRLQNASLSQLIRGV